MNIAIIFAGGTGQRMHTKTRPKQFLEMYGKPIIVYTLEKFQNHSEIDGIVLVCVADWIEHAKRLVQNYGLSKVVKIIPGGATGQESIYNGLIAAQEICESRSIVLIHDGVRPVIDESTITKAIECVRKNGSAITVTPAIETIAVTNNEGVVEQIYDRKLCQLARAPQCFYLEEILQAHQRARAENQLTFIDSASLMRHYGHSLYTIEGAPDNIKITTQSDFYAFRAILDARENSEVFGI